MFLHYILFKKKKKEKLLIFISLGIPLSIKNKMKEIFEFFLPSIKILHYYSIIRNASY